MTRMRKRFLDCKDLSIEDAAQWGTELAELQRDIMFQVGDLARYAEARWPDTHPQVWPEWVSPGMLARAAGVCKAYPKEEDRQHEATYTQYLQNSARPDRQARLQAIIDKGLTSDESRKADQEERASDNRPRWLLAADVHYHLHRHWFSGAGVEAAVRVAEWLQRTVGRLKEEGLTDVVCAFEGQSSFRKELTKDWEDKYKNRPPKDSELIQQLHLVRDLLAKRGFACVSHDGFEADDVMASYATQFPGRVTLLSADKDMRQCLSDRCNILLDVEWNEDPTSGEALPDYKWLTGLPSRRLVELRSLLEAVGQVEGTDGTPTLVLVASQLKVDIIGNPWPVARQKLERKLDALIAAQPPNVLEMTGIRPDQWAAFQSIMGDTVDGVKGVAGIGEKGAADLIKGFGTVEKVIAAAKAEDERIKPKRREALIEFEAKLDVTRQLVTLKTALPISTTTRI